MASDFAAGEFKLITRLTQGLTESSDVALGIGDDCAVLDLGGDALLLATCDSQVEGVHFTMHTTSPEQIGRKALAVNLSDIAAMGGEPRYALVSLILPPQLPLAVIDGIYTGLRQEAERYATAIVGGNIAGTGKAEQLIIDITLLGTVARGHVLARSGARAGDVLCVTGAPGSSAAGLHTLLHPDQHYPADALELVRQRHCMPQARVHEGQVLSCFGPSVVTAALDISDGLSGDLEHLCERSNVGARIDLSRLPLSSEICNIAKSIAYDPVCWAMHGGEDYELLFTVTSGQEHAVIEAIQTATGTPVTVIGTILHREEGMKQVYPDGRVEKLSVMSWDHLKQK
jgi:thiamine-monophosphate kinase